MSDEEKKVIEHLKIVAKERTIMPLDDEIRIVLNLIEKQSKEIEELKEKNENLLDALNNSINIKKYWVNKDKIKAKIEEVDENGYWEFLEKRDEDKCKDILQSLLEKE